MLRITRRSWLGSMLATMALPWARVVKPENMAGGIDVDVTPGGFPLQFPLHFAPERFNIYFPIASKET